MYEYAINEAGRFVKNSRERLYLERSRMDFCVRELERERERWSDNDEKNMCVRACVKDRRRMKREKERERERERGVRCVFRAK